MTQPFKHWNNAVLAARLGLACPLRCVALMRVASSFKLIVATWVAAILGALVGRSLAEASRPPAGAAAPSVAVDSVGAR